MKDPREVIIRPIISEHSYEGMENNVYTFEVAKSANKIEIAQAIEAIFDVKVVKVTPLTLRLSRSVFAISLVRPAPGRRPWLRLLKATRSRSSLRHRLSSREPLFGAVLFCPGIAVAFRGFSFFAILNVGKRNVPSLASSEAF